MTSPFLKCVICLATYLATAASALTAAEPQGFVEGHLKIISFKEVELAGAPLSKSEAISYVEYPLVVLDKAGRKQITRFTADEKGNYHIALPPGDYILDLEGRGPGRGGPRAKPQPFTIVSNQTAYVDMTIDTHVR